MSAKAEGIQDPCVYCGESTAFGSGRFVNRIGVNDGWGCAECSGYECDECDKNIYLDEEVRVQETEGFCNYHAECYDAAKHGRAEYGAEVDA